MRAYEFILEKSDTYDQDTIDLVKMDWDAGKTPQQIGDNLGLKRTQVADILARFYFDRPGKRLPVAKALTDEDKASIVARFVNGEQSDPLAASYGVAPHTIRLILIDKLGQPKYDEIQKSRQVQPGTRVSNKLTSEMKQEILRLYRSGKSMVQISNIFNNVVAWGTVKAWLWKQPDWQDIKAENLLNRQRQRASRPVTTKIYRPGTIGNLRSKNPGSRHASGMLGPPRKL